MRRPPVLFRALLAALCALVSGHRAAAEPSEESIPGLMAFWSNAVSHATRLGEVDWSRYDTVSVATEVDWPATNDAFYAGGPTDYFAVRLVGSLEIPESGVWTVGISSDAGARLYIDGAVVINDDANHSFRRRSAPLVLTAGSHTIEIRYLEVNYSQGLVLDWAGPGVPTRVAIPSTAFWHDPAVVAEEVEGKGLRAYWTSDLSHATTLGEADWTQYDSTSIVPNVSWPITNNAFYTGGPTDYFSARLVGTITIPESGSWTFKIGSDAGARLYINGALIINDDANHSFRFRSGSVSLGAGEHTVEIRYHERNYTQCLVATWQAPSATFEEVIPTTAFTPAAVVPPGETGDGLNAYWSDAVSHASLLGEVDWTRYDRQTSVAKLSWRITNGPFQTDGPTDYFAARFVGRITIPAGGSWRFKLGSDAGARLLIDGAVVVNDDANHSFRFAQGTMTLTPGEHDIEVLYLERNYSQGLVLTWQAPGAAHEEVVPASAFSPAGLADETGGLGLRAYWSSGVSHATRLGQVDWSTYDNATAESDVSWEITNSAFYTGGPTDYFAVRLVGLVRVPQAGNWTFKLGSDAGARLYVNGELVVNDDANHSFRFRSGSISLPEGDVRVEVRYLEVNYSQGLVLTWQGPGVPLERVIPPSAFSPDPDEPAVDEGGGGLRAYWASNISHATLLGETDWHAYDTTGVVPKVNWRITNSAFTTGGPTDYFGLRLMGTIEVPSGGAWTFGLGSDAGARLFINGQLVVNDDANHSFRFSSGSVTLDAGTHDIEIRYIERNYSQGLVLTWQGPSGFLEEVVPSSALQPAPLLSPGGPFAGTGGLTAVWTSGRHSVLDSVPWESPIRSVTTTLDNVAWRITNGAFYTGGPTDYFQARITGRINIPASGDWTFKIGSDAGARLLIDGEVVVNDDANHSFRFTPATVALEAGVHAFEVRYMEVNYSQGLVVTWQGPGVELEEVVPAEAFARPSGIRVVRWREVGVEGAE
jgi:hypothetical protein